jgi:hypothetical protein
MVGCPDDFIMSQEITIPDLFTEIWVRRIQALE